MARLVPIDYDPFASGPRLVPVDYDPFDVAAIVEQRRRAGTLPAPDPRDVAAERRAQGVRTRIAQEEEQIQFARRTLQERNRREMRSSEELLDSVTNQPDYSPSEGEAVARSLGMRSRSTGLGREESNANLESRGIDPAALRRESTDHLGRAARFSYDQPDTFGEFWGKAATRTWGMGQSALGGVIQWAAEAARTGDLAAISGQSGQQLAGRLLPEYRAGIERAFAGARERGEVPGQAMFEAAQRDLSRNEFSRNNPEAVRYVGMITDSIGLMAPTIAVSLATRSPTAGAATLGVLSGGEQYGESREQRRSYAQASIDGIFTGVAEAIPEMIPLGALMRPGGHFLKDSMTVAGLEGASEIVTQILETGYDMNVLRPDMTWAEAENEIRDAGIVGFFMGAGMHAAAHPFNRMAETRRARAVDAVERDLPQVQTPPSNVTPQDVASPLPTDLISEGKDVIDRAAGGERLEPRPADLAPAPLVSEGSIARTPRQSEAPVAQRQSPRDMAGRMYGITAQAESGNRERNAQGNLITSPTGAQGSMQVMPGTQRDPGFGVRPMQDDSDAERARVGRDYLAAMLRRYGGDPAKAWAAYNWGPGNLDVAIRQYGDDWLSHAPPETQSYVQRNVAALGGGQAVLDTADATVIEPDYSWIERPLEPLDRGESDNQIPSVATTNNNRLSQPDSAETVTVGDRPATIEERFDVNGEPGVRLRFEDGTTLEEAVSRLAQHGVRIEPVGEEGRATPAVVSAPDLAPLAMPTAVPVDFEEFAAQRGGSRQDVGDAGLHRSSTNVSAAAKRSALDFQDKKDAVWLARRDDLRAEYDAAVERGEIRPLTSMERLEARAAGHPDNSSTQAAIRLLEKRRASEDQTNSAAENDGSNEGSSVELPSKASRFDPEIHLAALKSYVAKRGRSLDSKAVARALGVKPQQAQRVLAALASQSNSGIFVSRKGNVRRIPKREGPVSLYHFLRDRDSVVDTEGHDLAKGRNLTRFPGLISKDGMNLDEALERAVEDGYFDTTDRQSYTTNDLLQRLENASSQYRPQDTAQVEDKRLGKESRETEARFREAIADTAREIGLSLEDGDIDAALGYMREGQSVDAALESAMRDASAAILDEAAEAAQDDFYSTVAEELYEGEHPEERDQGPDEGGARPAPAEAAARPREAADDERAGDGAPQEEVAAAPKEAATDLLGQPISKTDITEPFADEFRRLEVPDDLRQRIRDNAPQGFSVAGFLARWEEAGGAENGAEYDLTPQASATLTKAYLERLDQRRRGGVEPDMFGTREGDERRALERAGEGRLQSEMGQKAAGSDGGLFDVRDTTRDIEEVTQPESPIQQARTSLQQAMAALDAADEDVQARAEVIHQLGNEEGLATDAARLFAQMDEAKNFSKADRAAILKRAKQIERAKPGAPSNPVIGREAMSKAILERFPPPEDVEPEPPARRRAGQSLYQRLMDSDDPIFYSELERAVEASTTTRASAAQWAATLGRTPGVKKEELEWSGLFEWLDMQEGPISRDDLLRVVRDGGIRVEEVVLSGNAERREMYAMESEDGSSWDVRVASPDPDNRVAFFDTEAEARAYIRDNRPTKFQDWSSDPNNETYRELLITLPIAEGGNPTRDFKTHWDQPAVLAHARFMEKRDAEGRRVLFIEEVQSDRHQKGREEGYEQRVDPAVVAEREREEADASVAWDEAARRARRFAISSMEAAGNIRSVIDRVRSGPNYAVIEALSRHVNSLPEDKRDAAFQAMDEAQAADLRFNEASQALSRARSPTGIPNAPFKSSWPALVMKRMIRWAVDNGFERVAWTTGAEQNERYSLEKFIDSVELDMTSGGISKPDMGPFTSGMFFAYDKQGNQVDSRRVDQASDLYDVIGKELADKLVSAEPYQDRRAGMNAAVRRLDGLNLRTSGAGMEQFYDRNLVNITNDIIKHFGGKVETVHVLDAEHERILATLPQTYRDATPGYAEERRKDVLKARKRPGFTITTKMAAAAQSGFSLFQRGPFVDRRTFIKGATAVAGGFMVGDRLFAQPPGLTSILERSINEVVPLTEPLEWIAANSEDRQFRRFAARMVPLVRGIVVRGNPVGRRTHADGTAVPEDIWSGLAHGMHQVDEITDGDVVWLARGEWVNGFNEGTLVHEALHAALYRIFGRLSVRMGGNDPALLRREGFNREAGARPASEAQIAELRGLYQEAVTAFERKVAGMSAEENRSDATRHIRNGIGTPDEFLSYALENRDMQAFLREQPARGGKSTETLWDKIVTFIRRVLGLGDTPRTALDDALDTAYRLLADPQGPSRESNRVVEDSTAAELTRGDVTGRSALQRASEYAFEPEVEKRWQDARKGVGSGASMISKGKAAWDSVVAGMTRHWRYLPNSVRFADLREQFRKLEASPEVAKEETVRHLRKVVGKMTTDEYDLFTRKVVLDDLRYEVEREHQLPFGLTPETVGAERQRIDDAFNLNPKLVEALDLRREHNRKIADAMVAEGILTPEQVENPSYFRHMVLDYARAERQMARGTGEKISSPWWAKRAGSSLDINANFLEAEADWMLKAMVDIQTAKTIRFVQESQHNIREELRAQARARNKEGIDAVVAKSKDLASEEAEFRKRIAIGLTDIRKALESGDLTVPPTLQAAADSLTQKAPRDEAIFPLLSWVLENNKPGARGAAMTLKAISQRRAWARQVLGSKYLNPENMAELAKRIAPEGYVGWQPREGRHLFTAKTLPEHVVDRLISNLTDVSAFGISKDEMHRALDAIKPQLVVGGDRYTMVIPKEVADTLDEFGDVHAESMVARLFSGVQAAWKRWVLINPRRFFKYNLNNQLGDLDAVIAGHPATLRKVGPAARELYRVMAKGEEPSESYKDAQERGVFTSGLSIQEIPDINRLSALKHLTDDARSKRPDKLLVGAVAKVWRGLQGTTNFREAIFRYAAYLSLHEKMEAGQTQAQIGYGASIPKLVDAVTDNKDRAALMARDLVGDYGAVSVVGAWLRKYMIPFWSWMEINTRRYFRLTANVYRGSKAKGIATGGLLGAGIAGRTAVSLGIRMALVYGIVTLWNHLLFGDEEDDLSEQQKRQLHIILGRDSDGKVVSLRAQGALSDVLGTFGFPDAMAAFRRASVGQGDYSDILTSVAAAPVNRVGTSVTPIFGEPLEQALGLELWPDMFHPRPIQDRLRHLFSTVSLENEYDVVADRPSRGYWHSWTESIVYRRDPGEMAYDDIRGAAHEWLEHSRGESGTVNRTDPKSRALRDYRQALRYGDQDAARDALERFEQYDGTRRGLRQSIARAHPLGSIPKRYRRAFLRSLTDDQRETLRDAEAFYNEVYLRRPRHESE